MPIVQLTEIVARTARAQRGTQLTYWDRPLPGFELRIGEQVKTWPRDDRFQRVASRVAYSAAGRSAWPSCAETAASISVRTT